MCLRPRQFGDELLSRRQVGFGSLEAALQLGREHRMALAKPRDDLRLASASLRHWAGFPTPSRSSFL